MTNLDGIVLLLFAPSLEDHTAKESRKPQCTVSDIKQSENYLPLGLLVEIESETACTYSRIQNVHGM